MIEFEISKIIIDEKRQDQILVLKEKHGERSFPIVIGFVEASSIKMQLSGMKAPRPLTHDFIIDMIQRLEARVERMVVDQVIDNTFHAKVILVAKDGQERVIDARPSDGIALAVRIGAKIFVEEEVLKKIVVFNNP